jgi:hypothetical protein
MNYFQQYETEVRPFAVGKRFICVDPREIGIFLDAFGEIIEITEKLSYMKSVRYDILTGSYKRLSHIMSINDLNRGYKPYDGEIPNEIDEDDND